MQLLPQLLTAMNSSECAKARSGLASTRLLPGIPNRNWPMMVGKRLKNLVRPTSFLPKSVPRMPYHRKYYMCMGSREKHSR